MSEGEQETLSTAEAARILGVHKRTVQRLVKSGELRAYRAGLSKWRIYRHDLEEYIRRQSNQPREE